MVANTECPEFTTITANTTFITTRNIAELVPNVFNRSVGTKVTLSCFETYKLVGNKYIECLSTGRWNTTMPTCLPGTSGTGSSSSNVSSRSSGIFGGDNQMTILIIIVIIVAVIALIILLVFCCFLIWRNGRRRYKNKTKIDHLHTDYSRTNPKHMAGNNVYYISEYISDQNNLRWGNRFAESSRHNSEGLGEWMEILNTNRPQSHSGYHERFNREGCPYIKHGLYNYVWRDSSHYPGDLIRYHDHNDDNISTTARFSGHSYTHHDPYLWNDLKQPYFKIPRPAYIN